MTLDVTATGTRPALREHDVRGGDGTRLHAREWGDPDGAAILFVHGWSQCDLCWGAQVGGPLASEFRLITFDHRGHGRSEKPREASAYTDGRLWADDLACVIEQLKIDRPVVVAWSYGGLVVCDYLRRHGQDALGGIDFVGAAVMLRPPAFDHIGPVFLRHAPGACDPDLATSIAAVRAFLADVTTRPLDADLMAQAVAWNMAVPPEVRAALIARDVEFDDVLARITVPVLVTHGRRDAVVEPSMAEHVLERCPHADASWYEDVGHLPFVEDAPRFDRELAAFARALSR